jgi:hypothetical protein
VNTALDVQPGYAQLQVPLLFGKPYARRSGELGESDRDSEGGDLSEGTLEESPKPTEDDAEFDREGLDPPYEWSIKPVSDANIGAAAMVVNGG